ncbi:sensor histidine kinase [Nocardia goodfellowii]|uniref:histidine kinase n=1 Tax=Nocardia goodfellowii TaxID=882446 RepID=A0ABS4QL83_9NOCA|nr:sensor histidine kinase [Nocardia goodfellowii]MBP2192472.1 signal transduction histidine kinase [Nocardia goodfellowii]
MLATQQRSPVTHQAAPRPVWWREAIVLAPAFLLCLSGGILHPDNTLGWPPIATYVVAGISCAALSVRHRAPVVVVAVTTACGMLVAPLGLLSTPFIVVPVAIAAYALALHTELRVTIAVLLPAVALLVAVTPLLDELSWQDGSRLLSVAALPLIAGALGNATQSRRAYLAAMEERALRAEESRESEARRSVAEERVRIARELHDVVAHQITLANAQAVVAAHVFDSQPEQTRSNLDNIIETTRNALDDLRATVGLLRQAGDANTSAEPSPGLSQLPRLLESFDRAGLRVTTDTKGAPKPLPPGVDLTAYRIIQEALTNVGKHARTSRARIRLSWSRDRLSITVADDGPDSRAASASNEPGRTGSDRPSGYGLIGMRERAEAVGGRLSTENSPAGGFIVSAHLPLTSANTTGDTENGGSP